MIFLLGGKTLCCTGLRICRLGLTGQRWPLGIEQEPWGNQPQTKLQTQWVAVWHVLCKKSQDHENLRKPNMEKLKSEGDSRHRPSVWQARILWFYLWESIVLESFSWVILVWSSKRRHALQDDKSSESMTAHSSKGRLFLRDNLTQFRGSMLIAALSI